MPRLKLQALFFIGILHQVFACLQNAIPPEQWAPNEIVSQFRIRDRYDERALFVGSRGYEFTCEGTIHEWTIRWHYRTSTSSCGSLNFHFYVLNQPQECGPTEIRGQNIFPATVGVRSEEILSTVFNVEEGERIRVRPGDFATVIVAMTSINCPDLRVWVAGILDTNTVYYERFPSSFYALNPGLQNLCSHYSRDSSILPYFTAAVDIATATEIQPAVTVGESPTQTLSQDRIVSEQRSSDESTRTFSTQGTPPDQTSDKTISAQHTRFDTTKLRPLSILTSVNFLVTSADIIKGEEYSSMENSSCCKTSTAQGSSIRGQRNSVLIGVGSTVAVLSVVVLISTIIVISCIRYQRKKIKERAISQLDNRLSSNTERRRVESLYDYPHNFITGSQSSMKSNGAYGSTAELNSNPPNHPPAINLNVIAPRSSMNPNGVYASIGELNSRSPNHPPGHDPNTIALRSSMNPNGVYASISELNSRSPNHQPGQDPNTIESRSSTNSNTVYASVDELSSSIPNHQQGQDPSETQASRSPSPNPNGVYASVGELSPNSPHHPPIQDPNVIALSSSLMEGHGFMMSINDAYSS